jgi:hypothetical protein
MSRAEQALEKRRSAAVASALDQEIASFDLALRAKLRMKIFLYAMGVFSCSPSMQFPANLILSLRPQGACRRTHCADAARLTVFFFQPLADFGSAS